MENLDQFPREWICPGGNSLSKNEFLVSCAYDRNHRILNHRYSSHLIKCRTNYEVKKAKDGERPQWATCRYNMEHKMYEPELLYHERNCTDQKLPWLKNLYFANVQLFEAMLNLDDGKMKQVIQDSVNNGGETLTKLVNAGNQQLNWAPGNSSKLLEAEALEDQEARNAKIIGDLLKEINSSPTYGIEVSPWSELKVLTDRLMKMVKDRPSPYVLEDVLWPDPTIAKESGTTPFKKSTILVPNEDLTISQVMDPECFGYKRRPVRRHRRSILSMFKQPPPIPEELGDPDDDDWKLGDPSVSFDWLQHQHNFKGPMRLMPPGLTRAQRKKYEITITERLKYEEGIFVEEVESTPSTETQGKGTTSNEPDHSPSTSQ